VTEIIFLSSFDFLPFLRYHAGIAEFRVKSIYSIIRQSANNSFKCCGKHREPNPLEFLKIQVVRWEQCISLVNFSDILLWWFLLLRRHDAFLFERRT